MTSRSLEVNGSNVITNEEAKKIILNLIEHREKVEIIDILELGKWIDKTNNYSEDVAVIFETWLQENDYSMNDEFSYYKSCMETPTFYANNI